MYCVKHYFLFLQISAFPQAIFCQFNRFLTCSSLLTNGNNISLISPIGFLQNVSITSTRRTRQFSTATAVNMRGAPFSCLSALVVTSAQTNPGFLSVYLYWSCIFSGLLAPSAQSGLTYRLYFGQGRLPADREIWRQRESGLWLIYGIQYTA